MKRASSLFAHPPSGRTQKPSPYDRPNDRYMDYRSRMNRSFVALSRHNTLFTTSASNLFETFIHSLPKAAQAHYNCHTCRKFIDTYGGLVIIRPNGRIESAIWRVMNPPSIFAKAQRNLDRLVGRSNVTGVFLTEDTVLGTPETGEWSHFHVNVSVNSVCWWDSSKSVVTAQQRMADYKEEYNMLSRATWNWSRHTLAKALDLLRGGKLVRSEKFLPMLQWFVDLNTDNLWYEVAHAPTGFCHIKNTVVGSMLDNIEEGFLSEHSVIQAFNHAVSPLRYQRPQAAPASGNVAEANRLAEKLNLENALQRRFARISERGIPKLWPTGSHIPKRNTAGVFGSVETSSQRPTRYKDQSVTFRWFRENVLPEAVGMHYVIQDGAPYCALLTSVHPNSTPLFKWDNPFSWYTYPLGSSPEQWSLPSSGTIRVTAISLLPSMWVNNPYPTYVGAIFFLVHARDKRYRTAGIGLFPELIRTDLRPVRATIESFSRNNVLGGYNTASACGVMLQGSDTRSIQVVVTYRQGSPVRYTIDRWE